MLSQTIVSLLANVLDRRLPGVVNDASDRPPLNGKRAINAAVIHRRRVAVCIPTPAAAFRGNSEYGFLNRALRKKWSNARFLSLDDLRQIRAPRAALIVQILRLLARTICRDLVRPLEQLGVNTVAHDQPVEPILTGPAAFFALDAKHLELTD
jgi:hypothetical protein